MKNNLKYLKLFIFLSFPALDAVKVMPALQPSFAARGSLNSTRLSQLQAQARIMRQKQATLAARATPTQVLHKKPQNINLTRLNLMRVPIKKPFGLKFQPTNTTTKKGVQAFKFKQVKKRAPILQVKTRTKPKPGPKPATIPARRYIDGVNWKAPAAAAGGLATAYAVYSQLNKVECLKNSTLGTISKIALAAIPAVAGFFGATQANADQIADSGQELSTGKKALHACGTALAGVAGLGAAYVAMNGIAQSKADLFEALALNKLTESFCNKWPRLKKFFNDREFKKHLSMLVAKQDEASFVQLSTYMLETNPECGQGFIDNIADIFNNLSNKESTDGGASAEKIQKLGSSLSGLLLNSSKMRLALVKIINQSAEKIKSDPKKMADSLIDLVAKIQKTTSDSSSTAKESDKLNKSLCVESLTQLVRELNKKTPEELAVINQLFKEGSNRANKEDLFYELKTLFSKIGPCQTRIAMYKRISNPLRTFMDFCGGEKK